MLASNSEVVNSSVNVGRCIFQMYEILKQVELDEENPVEIEGAIAE